MIDAMPPPYGASDPDEPPLTPAGLLSAFVQGAQRGTAGSWRVEGPLLVGRDTPLAIRLEDAALVRQDLPPGAEDLRQACAEALAQANMRCVEQRTVLGHVVGIEVAGLRDAEWDLWAPDPETGHAALRARALGDVADRVDPEEPARREREAASLAEIERDLWP